MKGASPSVATLSRQPGARPLDAGVRSTMETRFGHDFGNVRVHADEAAAHSANALDARAYAMDSDIVFGSGEYQPRTPRGRASCSRMSSPTSCSDGSPGRARVPKIVPIAPRRWSGKAGA